MSSVDRETKGPETKGRAYWRSLEEWADTPAFREALEKEFPSLLPEGFGLAGLGPATRRQFLKVMGASMALAGVVGCNPNNPTWPRWKPAKILPYAHRPEGRTPGTPEYYATAFEIGGVARALLAKSYDGRPIKLEGNPEHPASQGAADLLSQGLVLGLYDPDRSRGPARFEGADEIDATWDEFLGAAVPALEGDGRGQGVAILAEASTSPTLARMRAKFAERWPGMRWVEWEAVDRDAAREGARLVFGEPLRTHPDLELADVVVTFEDDFLFAHPNAIAHTKAWARNRNGETGSMSRLWAVESAFSLTGSQADHRIPVPSAQVPQVAWCLAARIFLEEGVELPRPLAAWRPALEKALAHGDHFPQTARMAKDLVAAPGRGLVTVGPSQPASMHALAHALNEALGNAGRTVRTTADPDAARPTHVEGLRGLAADARAGRVKALLVLGGNPVYDAPADFAMADAIAKIPFSAHLSLHRDETSAACRWHVPRAHALEAWGDARSWDGTWTIAQPIIRPLFDGLTPAELLATLVDGTRPDGEALVRDTLAARHVDRPWRRAVHDGFVAETAWPTRRPPLREGWVPVEADFAWSPSGPNRTEVTFRPDAKLFDGRFANNGWLQELPDPMTKLAWDNAALMNPVTARAMGMKQGDVVRLNAGSRALEIPVYLMPGQAVGSVSVALGYGRARAGRVAERDSDGRGGGFDAYPFRTSDAMHTVPVAEIVRVAEHYPLVTTQEHHAIKNEEQGRGQEERLPAIFREATLAEYREHPDFAAHRTHHPPLVSLWEEKDWTQSTHRWAMSIDLASCTGCSACVVACQAENNNPVVGKSEVGRGREMHWIRVDRYFRGDFENPEVAHQPVTCHQCENAPCEQVCPVAATVHSSEGLNDMVYNRCVGTRYCSNNCPYKVRRFNYFNNQAGMPELPKMQFNPDVTVRSRGVMEKCTYCVQRIKAVTIPAGNENRPVRDGEIVPACAQTCPADAIVFGDLQDPESRVSRLHRHPRAYALLAELNVKPRTRYLAKLRNPADAVGHGGGGAHDGPGNGGTGNGHGAEGSHGHG